MLLLSFFLIVPLSFVSIYLPLITSVSCTKTIKYFIIIIGILFNVFIVSRFSLFTNEDPDMCFIALFLELYTGCIPTKLCTDGDY